MAQPLRVAKAQHGCDHWTVGEGPPFFAVTRTEHDAMLVSAIPVMRAEITRLVLLCQEAHDAILGGPTDRELLEILERAWNERAMLPEQEGER